MENSDQHIVTIENRKRVTATKIESVDQFSPTQLVLSYSGGKIVIAGSSMKITSFSKSGGTLTADGTINGVKYQQKGVSLRQKLFR